MKNKKTIVAIIAVLLVAVVGVTFAYFQSTGTFENIFQTGVYRLVTREVFESPDNWTPGQEVPKTITTTNEGTFPAAVRISYTEQWLDGETDITSSVDEGSAIINFDNTSDWIEEDGYYYYKYILNPEETTSSFIKSVTLNEELDEVNCTEEGLTHVCEASNPALGAKYKLTLTIETIQADKFSEWNSSVELTEKPENTVTILSGTKGNLQPGDMVGIGETEDFYVISSDNSSNGKTLLLAKYNLLVGDYSVSYGEYAPIPTTEPGYGLQNEDANSYYSSDYELWKGNVYFSTNYYWDDNGLISPYNANEASYDGNPYPYVYDENSDVYQYISGDNGYINRLVSMGAPSTITGRLLTYEEIVSLIDIEINGSSIIYNDQSYWSGSASRRGIWNILSGTNCLLDDIYYSNLGVRPVIEIYTKDIN